MSEQKSDNDASVTNKVAPQLVTKWQGAFAAILLFYFLAVCGYFFNNFFALFMLCMAPVTALACLFYKAPGLIVGNKGRSLAIAGILCSSAIAIYGCNDYLNNAGGIFSTTPTTPTTENVAASTVPPEYKETFQKASIACPGFNPSASEFTIGAPKFGGIYYDGEFHSNLKGFSIEITGLLSYAPTAHGNHCEYYLTQERIRSAYNRKYCNKYSSRKQCATSTEPS